MKKIKAMLFFKAVFLFGFAYQKITKVILATVQPQKFLKNVPSGWSGQKEKSTSPAPKVHQKVPQGTYFIDFYIGFFLNSNKSSLKKNPLKNFLMNFLG